MSDVKYEDLPPAPFFARFLEQQFARPLTAEEMKAVRGGSDPRAQDNIVANPGPGPFPGWMNWSPAWPAVPCEPSVPGIPGGAAGFPCTPAGASPVTMAYPSDSVGIPMGPI